MTIEIDPVSHIWTAAATAMVALAGVGIAALISAITLMDRCRAELRAWRRQRKWELDRRF